jgi:hypothetical protein
LLTSQPDSGTNNGRTSENPRVSFFSNERVHIGLLDADGVGRAGTMMVALFTMFAVLGALQHKNCPGSGSDKTMTRSRIFLLSAREMNKVYQADHGIVADAS